MSKRRIEILCAGYAAMVAFFALRRLMCKDEIQASCGMPYSAFTLAASVRTAFQCELDQSRGDRGLGDHAEICSSKDGAWIAELRMVQGVVELDTKSQFRVLAQSSHDGPFTQRKIGVQLRRPVENALACVAVPRGAIGADGRRRAQCRRINPGAKPRFQAAGCGYGGKRPARAEIDGRGRGLAVDRAAIRILRVSGKPLCRMTMPVVNHPFNSLAAAPVSCTGLGNW